MDHYINMDFEGLKEAIVRMIADEKVYVSVESFNNDMTSFKRKDDVLTLLILLGYLSYDNDTKRCFIPNQSVKEMFISSIRKSSKDSKSY